MTKAEEITKICQDFLDTHDITYQDSDINSMSDEEYEKLKALIISSLEQSDRLCKMLESVKEKRMESR